MNRIIAKFEVLNTHTMVKKPCKTCGKIPDRVEGNEKIKKYRKVLVPEGGTGRYYRGESLQLSVFRLLKCTECSTYFEDGHHYYSDPESTMGLGRDESDWYILKRLTKNAAEELKSRIA